MQSLTQIVHRFVLRITMFLLFSITVMQLDAQIPLPPAGPGEENPDNTPPVPVDGGLTIVLAAGAGYGAKKLRQYKKRKEVSSL